MKLLVAVAKPSCPLEKLLLVLPEKKRMFGAAPEISSWLAGVLLKTCSEDAGVLRPTPTSPFARMVMRSMESVLKTSLWASLVPKKLVGGVVPEFPVNNQFWEKLWEDNTMPAKRIKIFFIPEDLIVKKMSV